MHCATPKHPFVLFLLQLNNTFVDKPGTPKALSSKYILILLNYTTLEATTTLRIPFQQMIASLNTKLTGTLFFNEHKNINSNYMVTVWKRGFGDR